jgi:type VI secretion system Hcp family effector
MLRIDALAKVRYFLRIKIPVLVEKGTRKVGDTFEETNYTMRHQTILVVLATTLSAVGSIWVQPGRAQKPEMTLTPKKDGAFKAQGGSSIVLGSLKDVSSIMQITRSNIDGYQRNTRAPLVISKEPDAASTQLFDACQHAEVIPEISFKLYKPGDNTKYKIVTLTEVTISHLTVKNVVKDPNSASGRKPAQTGARAGKTTQESNGEESMSLNFTKLAVAYYSGGNASPADDWDTK